MEETVSTDYSTSTHTNSNSSRRSSYQQQYGCENDSIVNTTTTPARKSAANSSSKTGVLVSTSLSTKKKNKGTPLKKIYKRFFKSESATKKKESTKVQESSGSSNSVLSSLTEEGKNHNTELQSPPRRTKGRLSINDQQTLVPDPPTSSPLMPATGTMNDFFLPEDSSSSGSEGPPSPVKTPAKSLKEKYNAMRTPGISIPTPQQPSRTSSLNDEEREKAVLFPHPLRTITESPAAKTKIDVHNQSLDEDAFLPDDFKTTMKTYTWQEVQKYIHDAENKLQEHLEDKHRQDVQRMKEESEKAILEHASQWKAEHDQDCQAMEGTLKNERAKIQEKQSELVNQGTEMSVLKAQLENFKLEREEYESHIASLEKQIVGQQQVPQNDGVDSAAKEKQKQELDREFQELQEQMKALNEEAEGGKYQEEIEDLRRKNAESEKRSEDLQKQLEHLKHRMEVRSQSRASELRETQERHQEELRKFQAEKDEANRKALELQDQLILLQGQFHSLSPTEDLIVLKSEKAASERKLREMEEQIVVKTEEKQVAQTSLRDAQEEIRSLRTEVDRLRLFGEVGLDVSLSSESSQINEELSLARAQSEALCVLQQEDEEQRRTQMQTIIAERDSLKSYVKQLKQQIVADGLMNSTTSAMVNGADDERLKVIGRKFAQLQAEKTELETILEATRAMQPGDIQEAVRQAVAAAELKMQAIQTELEEKEKEHEAEKRNIRADLTVAEISELTAEVQELQKRHQTEIKELQQQQQRALDLEKEHRLEKENSTRCFEEEKQQMEARYKQEIQHLILKIQTIQDEQEQAIELAKKTSKEEAESEMRVLQSELEKTRIEFEDEKIEIIQSSSKEQDELMSKLDGIQESSRAQIETAHSEARKEMEDEIKSLEELLEAANEKAQQLEAISKERDEYRVQVVSVQQELEVANGEKQKLLTRLQTLASQLDEKDEAHKLELDLVKKESQEAIDRELASLEESLKQMEMGDSEAKKKVKQLQGDNDTLRLEADVRVKELRDSHAKEIDEMLAQLDLVEAEHREKFSEKEKMLLEKEAVIAALGSQLAEAQTRLSTTSESQEGLENELKSLREQLGESKADVNEKAEDINRMLAEHQKALEEQDVLREQAVYDAEQEMIKKAEVQFKERNEHYKQLKHKFDETVSKIATMEAEITRAKKEADEARKRKEAIEIDLADELAQAKKGKLYGHMIPQDSRWVQFVKSNISMSLMGRFSI